MGHGKTVPHSACQKFDKLVDGGVNSPATAKRIASNLRFEPVRSAEPTWISKGNPTAPYQILLELRCNSGRKICKVAIFPSEKSAPVVDVHAADHDFTGYAEVLRQTESNR